MRTKFIFAALLLLLFSSCREEIIPPGNPAGNINQPVKETYYNSFSFLINAGDITFNLQENLRFDDSRVQVYISILDYSAGSVEVSLVSKVQQVIYSKKADGEIRGEYSRINNIPNALLLKFNDFTGKFKLSINRY